MPRPSLIERYFAQCQAHRSAPLPSVVSSLRDGVVEVNLADRSLADIRLFALAVLDTSTTPSNAAAAAGRTGGPSSPQRERRRGDGAASTPGDVSSASSTHGQAATFFTKLHFSYDLSSARRQQHTDTAAAAATAAAGRGRGGRGAVTAASSSPPPLLAPQSEATLRCLIEAVTLLVKENASTLKSFAWCGLPVVPPTRGPLSARLNSVSLTQPLPLCRHLTSLRIEGVALSRAQFMQLTMTSLSRSMSDVDNGSWLALEEASFVNCDLTDACKSGVVRLIRAALPMRSAELWRRSLRSSTGSGDDSHPSLPPATTVYAGTTGMRGLRRLDLSENPISDETARAIASAVAGSALHTLRLANTAITGKGAALLLLPAVLEENAMELVDLSNTEVSNAYGTAAASASATSAAELRLLAASSIEAGFRVVARGMGQLLVLREATRTPQQPWNVRTHTSSSFSSAVAAPPRLSSQPTTPAQLIAPRVEGARERSQSRNVVSWEASHDTQRRNEAAAAAAAAEDPFGAFINTRPAPVTYMQSSASSPPPPPPPPPTSHPPQSKETHPQQSKPANLGGKACPFASPPAMPAGTGVGNPFNLPWWSMLGPWCGMPPLQQQQSQQFSNLATGVSSLGEGHVPVPVPFPVPVFTALPMPYASAGPNAFSWPPTAVPLAAFPPPPSATTTTSAAKPAGQESLGDGPEDGVSSPPAADQLQTEKKEEEQNAHPAEEKAGVQKTNDDVAPAAAAVTGREDDGFVTPSVAPSLTDASSSLSAAAIRAAGAAAGDSKFLLALIARLEAHETDISERLEQQFQRTTTQLTAMEKDVRFRLQQLAEADRKERAAAAERQSAVLEAVAALHENPVRSAAEAMSDEMLTQLVKLIETGMTRVQTAMEKVGGDMVNGAKERLRVSSSSRAAPATSAAETNRDMVKETNQRLKQLGW